MDKVEKAVVDLNGEWPDDRFKGVLVWNTDGDEGDKCGYSAYSTFTPGFPGNQELVCTYEEFMDAASRSRSMNPEHSGSTEGEGVKWEPGVDLPPVGECVEIAPSYSHEVFAWFIGKLGEVVAHDRIDDFYAAVVKVEDKEVPCFRYHSFTAKCFARPKSHRDKCIEAAVQEFIAHYECPKSAEQYLGICRRLYDAGLLRLPNDKEGENGNEARLLAMLDRVITEEAVCCPETGELGGSQEPWIKEAIELINDIEGEE